MSVANCPSCGAAIEFAVGTSEVVVCGYCRSIVARTDRGIEDHGKVAALIDTGSPLRVGTTGKFRSLGFRITGRTQLRHQAGGVWDEWYASLDDGRWAWLAEAQGRFYVTFKATATAPSYDALQLGARPWGAGVPPATAGHPARQRSAPDETSAAGGRDARPPLLDDLVVAEIGEAKLESAEGELPWTPDAGATYRYADLTGAEHKFATIDYSEEPPIVFEGTETTLQELGIRGEAARAARVTVTALNCSQCGGALDLKAPDQAERIWCPYCGAGHDIANGKLQFFEKLKKKKIAPRIPLGTTGTIDGQTYVVAGFMERAVHFDRDYFWTEYLLYNRAQGYRWLVNSDDHWSFVTPLRPGEVLDGEPRGSAKTVHYEGKAYRLFQSATARVTYVLGEFYWRVAVGERVDTVDYVRPPFGLSKELTTSGAQEISYSHARYAEPREIEKAFGVEKLARPSTVGPMQPFRGAKLGGPWAAMLVLLFAVAMFLAVTRPGRIVYTQFHDLGAAAQPEGAPDNARVLFTEPFPLDGRNNVEVRASSALQNAWLYLALDLINDETNEMQSFELPLEYYSGVDGGERWSEGKHTRSIVLARPPKGRYVMRVEGQWEAGKPAPPQVHIRVREGVFRFSHFVLAFLAISIFPALALVRQMSFEAQRWKDSDYSPFGTSSGDDEEEEE